MSNTDHETLKAGPITCSYIVPRKKRKCRMHVKPGKKYCGEHDLVKSIDISNKPIGEIGGVRIPCPNDMKHTCNSNRLEKHLKVCPSRPRPEPSYCVKGINSTPRSDENKFTNPWTVNSVDDDHLVSVIDRIEQFYKSQCFDDSITTEILKHDVVEEYINDNPTFGSAALKHLKQNSSLLANVEKDIKFNKEDKIAYVEFGSGRGQLTYWVVKAFEHSSRHINNASEHNLCDKDFKFILIDKASHRHKFDNKLKDENPKLDITRVRVDIEDVVLKKIDDIDNHQVIAISKHLCGAATDLALNALSNFVHTEELNTKNEKEIHNDKSLLGVMIAFCCHHRCNWESFVGKKYLVDIAGFTEREFTLLCGLTSWATCGAGKPRSKGSDESDIPQSLDLKENKEGQLEDSTRHEDQIPLISSENLSRYERLNLSPLIREEIGRKTKRILDAARCQFIKEQVDLPHVKLKYYTPKDVTVENVVVVANK